jgi:hypothetical protein
LWNYTVRRTLIMVSFNFWRGFALLCMVMWWEGNKSNRCAKGGASIMGDNTHTSGSDWLIWYVIGLWHNNYTSPPVNLPPPTCVPGSHTSITLNWMWLGCCLIEPFWLIFFYLLLTLGSDNNYILKFSLRFM